VLHHRQEPAVDELPDPVRRHAQDLGGADRCGPVRVVLVGVPIEREPLDVGPIEADLPVRDRLAEDATADERETLSSWMPRISTASAPLMPILGSPRPC
jgi:hypothetical protein